MSQTDTAASRLTSDGSFSGFVSRGEAARGSYHFIGVQAAQAGAFGAVPDGRVANIHGVYDALAASNPGCVRGHLCDAAFWDIGTPADYWETNAAFLGSEPPERTYGTTRAHRSHVDVTGSILWNDVEVQGRAVVEDCIVTDGVTVPAGSTYRRSILVRDGNDLVATRWRQPQTHACSAGLQACVTAGLKARTTTGA